MRAWLVAAVVVLLAVAGVVVARHRPTARPVVTDAPPETVLRADQVRITGTVTGMHVIGVTQALALPITVSVPERGVGGMTITGVSIASHPGTVSWDAGQPLPLSGSGSVDLQQVALDADGSGRRWHLDGLTRLLTPGAYTAGSSVGIGTAGLAEAVDRVSFTVAPNATGALVSRGDAQVDLPPGPVTMTGPGYVSLVGTLTAQTAAGTRAVHQVTFRTGPFELSLNVSPRGGYIGTCLLQGAVELS